MEGLILGVNTLYRFFCFFKLFPMVGKGLTNILGLASRFPLVGVKFVLLLLPAAGLVRPHVLF